MSKSDESPLWKAIEKEYGEGVILTADSILEQPVEIIPTTPLLDMELGGGIPLGTWVSLAGPPKSGKSTYALNCAASAQKIGMKVYYLNVEHRLKKMNLMGIRGLDLSPEKFQVIQSTKDRILSGADFLNIATMLLHDEERIFVIVDSLSAFADVKELEEGLGTETRSSGYKIVAQFTRIVQSVVPLRRSIIAGIVHMIANTSGQGASKVERAANSWIYQADVRLRITWTEAWKVGERQIGQIVHWKILASALGSPGAEVKTYLRYGIGYDRVYERMEQARDLKLIEVKGAWFLFHFLAETEGEVVKCQGGEKAYQLLLGNSQWLELLEQKIVALLGSSS